MYQRRWRIVGGGAAELGDIALSVLTTEAVYLAETLSG